MTETLRDTAIRQAAAWAREKYAGEERRWARGLLIALNHGVMLGDDGIDRIQSDRNPEIYYEVKNGQCDCPDAARAPDFRCKHHIAATLVRMALQGVSA